MRRGIVNQRPKIFMTLAAALLAVLLASGCSVADQAAGEARNEAKQAVDSVRQEIEKDPGTGAANQTGGSTTTVTSVTVERVVDGDTLELAAPVESRTTVRLVGVDTPESAKPGEKPQPLGKEAAAFTEERLEGREVRFSLASDPVDPYYRLLGNVRLPGDQRLHAEAILANGMGQTLFYEPNTEQQAKFTTIQENARQTSAGIWGLPSVEKCLLTDRGNDIGDGSAAC